MVVVREGFDAAEGKSHLVFCQAPMLTGQKPLFSVVKNGVTSLPSSNKLQLFFLHCCTFLPDRSAPPLTYSYKFPCQCWGWSWKKQEKGERETGGQGTHPLHSDIPMPSAAACTHGLLTHPTTVQGIFLFPFNTFLSNI